MMRPQDHKRARLFSAIAATVIALACGTNYVYSAWAPQFAQRLKLSSTQTNLIGTFGNLGMYASGVPLGMLVDYKGPRWGVAVGVVFFALGYYPIAKAYEAGQGAYSVAALCLFSFFSGCGSASAFSGAIKACALNYPESRGTATAFPLAAFGLSAFFFSTINWALPHSTYVFLMLLASGTVGLPIISFPFLRVFPAHGYSDLPQEDQALHRTSSDRNRNRNFNEEPGAHDTHQKTPSARAEEDLQDDNEVGEENSSLITKSSNSAEDLENPKQPVSDRTHESPHLDIRGFALLPRPEFWQLFLMLGLFCGIGLMTINNIGADAQALWRHYDSSVNDSYIEKRQVLHVSILSLGSFTGRLSSGIGSDLLVSKLNRSRFWCLCASAIVFSAAQLVATRVENPNLLFLVSGLTGLAYGFLFGVYPSLISHAFGVHGLSQNWGTMTMAPVIFGNIFNLMYGKIYDANSSTHEEGHSECLLGKRCYTTAYWVTFVSALVGIAVCLWSIRHENEVHLRNEKEKGRTNHDRTA